MFLAQGELDSASFPGPASSVSGGSGIYKIAVISSMFFSFPTPPAEMLPTLLQFEGLPFLCQSPSYSLVKYMEERKLIN